MCFVAGIAVHYELYFAQQRSLHVIVGALSAGYALVSERLIGDAAKNQVG